MGNEKRRLDRKIARIDRGQWYKTASPEKQVKAPEKITFEEFTAKRLSMYSIVQLDADSYDNWPECPLHLAMVTDFDLDDEMITTSLLKRINNRLIQADQLSVSFEDIKYIVRSLPINEKLTS